MGFYYGIKYMATFSTLDWFTHKNKSCNEFVYTNVKNKNKGQTLYFSIMCHPSLF